MALGGGSWRAQNKVLPGSYINFISAKRGGSSLAERGVAAMPLVLPWGIEDEVFTVTAEDFRTKSLELFGYPPTAAEVQGLSELFSSIVKAHFYRVNQDAAKAENIFASAKHGGVLGNTIKTVIFDNEESTGGNPLFDVLTYFGDTLVDEQMAIKDAKGLAASPYVDWKPDAVLETTAGTLMVGGTDGTKTDAGYQLFLNAIEPFAFNTLGLVSTSETLKALFANFTKRMRDEVGAKFQCVLYRYEQADHEGIVSVENKLMGEAGTADDSAALVYHATGALAGVALNESLTNRPYTGAYKVDTAYTQQQLAQCLKEGKFVYHMVDGGIRVLEDINTLTSFTEERGRDFASNQVVRVMDQIGNDIARIFNSEFIGKIPNDDAGRISLWNRIVSHHKELEALRAIQNFSSDHVVVLAGSTKDAVVVTDSITPTAAMARLYMTVIIE